MLHIRGIIHKVTRRMLFCVKISFMQELFKLLLVMHEQQVPLMWADVQEPFSGLVLQRAGELHVEVHHPNPQIPLDLHIIPLTSITRHPIIIVHGHGACLWTGFTKETEIVQDITFFKIQRNLNRLIIVEVHLMRKTCLFSTIRVQHRPILFQHKKTR